MSQPVPALADRLNALWDAHRRPDGHEWPTSYVAQQLAVRVSPQYLARLRAGEESSRSPSGDLLAALATWWGVPVEYLLTRRVHDDHEVVRDVHAELLQRGELHAAGGLELLQQYMRLNDGHREVVRELVRLLLSQEDHPQRDDRPGRGSDNGL